MEHYKKCRYSGRKVNKNRSRAAFKRHHGEDNLTRRTVWREKDQPSTPNPHNETSASKLLDLEISTTPCPMTNNIQNKRRRVVMEDNKEFQPTGNQPFNNCPVETVTKHQTTEDKGVVENCTTPRPPKQYVSKNKKVDNTEGIRQECAIDPSKLQQETEKNYEPLLIEWPFDKETEKHQLTIENVPQNFDNLNDLEGYRVVDIKHILKWSINLQKDHSKRCTASQIEFVKEERAGLSCTFIFKCETCNEFLIHSSEKDCKINNSFVWGVMTSASYYSQANSLLSAMDVPTMSEKTYIKAENKLGKFWEDQLFEDMKKAGDTEREMAIAKGHVCSDGVPYITVFVDGGWSKRTYGHNYNASSGIACIIGKETKQCLYLGVKNKYCTMCYYNEKNNTNKDHVCFKNYEGTSTGMEAAILVEGFSKSIEMHGVRYTSFIGDGDSSVFSKLKNKVSYGNIIKKLECKNHVLKNYTSALYKIQSEKKIPMEARKLVGGKIKKLVQVARLNIANNSSNIALMRSDLKNGVHHVFGEHKNCASYYCRWKEAEEHGNEIAEDTNVLPTLQKHITAWGLLETAIDNVSRKADRLTANITNNVSENLMSIMAKFNCGKRLNLTKRGSYQRRAHLAGLFQISGHSWIPKAWKNATASSPGYHYKRYIARKTRISAKRKMVTRRRLFKPKPVCAKPDKDYGPTAEDPPIELSDSELHALCEEKLSELQVDSLEKIREIERESVGQHGNEVYDAYRKDRLTASNFGMVCKRKSKTAGHNHVKTILYKSNFSNDDTRFGQKYENTAIKMFEQESGKKVNSAGLFIDVEHGFLGASPDGIVEDEDSIVEVKCFPSLARSSKSLEDAAKTKRDFPLTYSGDGDIHLKKNHNFYYQIQGQLHISRKSKCYLICFIDLSTPITVVVVERDEEFIKGMVDKLITFYKKYVLPEIILRRVPANLRCKEPSL